MNTTTEMEDILVNDSRRGSKKGIWTGRILSGLAVAFLLMDSLMKVARVNAAVEATVLLGYPEGVLVPLGVVLLVCTVLYAIPRTAVIGAVLLTGYLGGAIATNVRVSAPLFTQVLFPIYVAALLWGGLFLRDRRVRGMISAD